MSDKTLIVGNWKMHLNNAQASLLVHRLQEKIRTTRDLEVVLAPSLLSLQPLSLQLDRRKFRLAAQDAYPVDEGPYTGEVSFTMLRDLVHYVIIGHSARRVYFNESLQLIRDKMAACVRNGITPILCIGETKEERKNGQTKQVLHDQLTSALSDLTAKEIEDIVIAYEPVWAITTFDGIMAKPDEAQEAMDFVREQVRALYGPTAARRVRVLYGGSVDPSDITGYLEIPGCQGALVGAASLNYVKFVEIIDAAYKLHRKAKKT